MTLDILKESIVFLGGVLVSAILLPLCLPIFRRLGVVDRPNARSQHTTAIPRGMGLVVVISFIAILSAYCAVAPSVPLVEDGKFQALLGSIAILVTVGFLDDLRGVSAWLKLFCQCASALILVLAGFVMPLPEWFGGMQSLVEQGFTLVWIVGVVNAINFIDGSDGLATTLSTVSMLLFVGISRILPMESAKTALPLIKSVNLLGLAGAGTALPFLLYNMSPARCFLGDAGSTFFGLLLAVLGILTAQYNLAGPVDPAAAFSYSFFLVPWLVLLVPLGDCARVTLSRLLRRESPFRPDNRHLHHVLHRAGLSPNQMLFIVTLSAMIFGLIAAILVRSNQSPFLLMGVVVLLVYGLFWFVKSSYRARRYVTLALNRRLLNLADAGQGYENPGAFKERFEQELARVKRHGGSLSVVVVNAASRKPAAQAPSPLENPKFLDNLLQVLRREDIKCRLSSDRLAFLLVETDKELAEKVCDRLTARFESIRQGDSRDLQVKTGVAGYPVDGVSVGSLLQRAEAGVMPDVLPVPVESGDAPRVAWDGHRRVSLPAIELPVIDGAAAALIGAGGSTPVDRPRWEAPRLEKESLVSPVTGVNGDRNGIGSRNGNGNGSRNGNGNGSRNGNGNGKHWLKK
ncbi:MAG TPA: diguanylate cyclase [Planctomycetota bacterium]|nr:diguanylate cyclase [Planctomycetota bacterium]